MSRDFRPVERFASNRQGGDNLWLQNLRFTLNDGESELMLTPEEQEARLRYPNLAVAMCDAFLKLRAACRGKEDVLVKLEALQVKMQDALLAGKKAFNECDVPQKMKEWFMGDLDPNFYYSEPNDQMYLDWCIKEYGLEQPTEV